MNWRDLVSHEELIEVNPVEAKMLDGLEANYPLPRDDFQGNRKEKLSKWLSSAVGERIISDYHFRHFQGLFGF
jgi:hypothetical protein